LEVPFSGRASAEGILYEGEYLAAAAADDHLQGRMVTRCRRGERESTKVQSTGHQWVGAGSAQGGTQRTRRKWPREWSGRVQQEAVEVPAETARRHSCWWQARRRAAGKTASLRLWWCDLSARDAAWGGAHQQLLLEAGYPRGHENIQCTFAGRVAASCERMTLARRKAWCTICMDLATVNRSADCAD
jgi:hypothetical protein